jgi:hypothetical protein
VTAPPLTFRLRLAFALVVVTLGVLGCCAVACAEDWGPFSNPQAVTIEGYDGSAEEPFITPDGRYLLFNSSESEPDFSLEYASRLNAQTFEYGGAILGEAVNEPGSLSGTPSLDQDGNLYFVSSPRSYFETLSTIYTGHFSEGVVTGVHLLAGVSGESLGKVDFDVGVSPDGSTLYVSVGQFGEGGGPTSARIVMFEREGDGFVADPESQSVMHAVNETATLNYGADLSYDGLELFFTAASPAIGRSPGIYRATRASVSQPFGNVERIAAITGFAEAPSISADGTTLYYHQEAGGEFAIMTVTRAATGPIVETDVASAITSGSAVLNATVNPDGEEVTDCYFEYGTTAASGSTGPCAPSPGSGAGPVAVTASLSGLEPDTTYHYRIVATSARGTSEGAVREFTTPPLRPPIVTALSPKKGTTAGGTLVTVTGSGFTGATTIKFGKVDARRFAVSQSGTTLTAESPQAPAGTVAIYVTTPSGTNAASKKDKFKIKAAKKKKQRLGTAT